MAQWGRFSRIAAALPALAFATPAGAQKPDAVLDKYVDVFAAIYACYRQPTGAAGMEVTVNFTFNRKGEVFGTPRIAYSKLGGDKSTQQDFVSAALKAIADCTPLKFSDQLGGAVAGRPFSIRFIGRASVQRT